MKINRVNDPQIKVDTKKELKEQLKRYRGILTTPTIDYLNSLIELEFSVVREYIKEEDRKSLAELEIYKKAAIYNIYKRALKLFKENEKKYNFFGEEDGLGDLTIYAPLGDDIYIPSNGDRRVKVFNFTYRGFQSNKVQDEYKTMQIGTISLYQVLEEPKIREAELNRVRKNLERLRATPNPGSKESAAWALLGFRNAKKIAEYETICTKLESKIELSDIDKRKIEITNQICNLLLEDYGLTNKNFEEHKEDGKSTHKESSLLEKTLVKRQPNLTITNNIKYI